MQEQHEYVGYSFEAHETFEWSTRHKLIGIKNSLAGLKEECAAEAHITDNHAIKDKLETTAKVLSALEQSFEGNFEEEGVVYSNKSDEPWD